MVAKRKQKQIAILPVEKPTYVILSKNEFEKNFERGLGILLVLEKKLKDINKAVKEYQQKKNAESEFNFVNDNEGPPLKPSYIRQFLAKFSYLEKKDKEKYNHWLCKIDEKWLLTQNFPKENFSKDHIQKEFESQDNAFVKHLTLCLKTLEKLRDFLKTSVEDDKVSDYLEIKEELILEVQHLLIKFTQEILFRTEHYMDVQDAWTSKYDYSSELFQFGFWILRNVPINISNEFQPSSEVHYNSINVKFSIPRSSLFENLVLLGIHWENDLFSETGNTFIAPPCTKIDNLGYILILEHAEKLELMDAKRKECIKRRDEYIDWLIKTKQYPVEEADPKIFGKRPLQIKKKVEVEKSKNKKDKSKNLNKKPEIITIPPEIKEHDLLDVEQEFCEREEARFVDYLDQADPKFYKMEAFEINQRQYILLGGVYQFEFVKKPDQTIYGNYLIVSNIEKPKEDANIDLESKSENNSMPKSEGFKITFKVPSHLCQWSVPVVCKWCPGKIEDKKSSDDLVVYKEDIIEDFDLNSLLEISQLENIKKHLIPRMTSASLLPERLLIETDEQYKLKDVAQKLIKYLERKRSPEYLFTTYEPVPAAKVVSNAKRTILRTRDTEAKKFSDILRELERMKNERKLLLEKFHQTSAPNEGDSSNIEVPIRPRKTYIHAEKTTRSTIKGGIAEMRNISGEKKFKKLKKKRIKEVEVKEQIVREIDNDEGTNMSPKWSTRNIIKSVFDSENNEITIWTKELGLYGFAFPRYTHFPFYNWSMIPHHEDCTRIVFTLMSQYVLFEIEITENGYIPKVIDSKIVYKTVIYFQTEEPIENIVLLKKKLQDYNFNIFPEKDTLIYVSEALEKHYATEYHTYDCMGLCCTYMQFCKSNWNKSSSRRILIMKCGDLREDINTLDDVKITPEEAQFVKITTLSTDDLMSNNIILDYKPNWKNIRFSADLWILIRTTYGAQIPRNLKKPKLCYNVITFLKAVRPLSFSV